MTDVLAFPFRFIGRRAATVVQDSDADLAQRARLVLGYPLGACVDLPEFGTADVTFGQGQSDVAVLEAALAEWEPDIPADAVHEVFAEAVDNVAFNIGDPGA